MSCTPSPQAWQRYSLHCCCAALGQLPEPGPSSTAAASADCACPLPPEPSSGRDAGLYLLLLGSCVLLDSSAGTGRPRIRHESGEEIRELWLMMMSDLYLQVVTSCCSSYRLPLTRLLC